MPAILNPTAEPLAEAPLATLRAVAYRVRGWAVSIIDLALAHWLWLLLGLALVGAVLALRSILRRRRPTGGVVIPGPTPVVPHRRTARPDLDPLRYEGAEYLITDEQARQYAEALLLAQRYEPPINEWLFREH